MSSRIVHAELPLDIGQEIKEAGHKEIILQLKPKDSILYNAAYNEDISEAHLEKLLKDFDPAGHDSEMKDFTSPLLMKDGTLITGVYKLEADGQAVFVKSVCWPSGNYDVYHATLLECRLWIMYHKKYVPC